MKLNQQAWSGDLLEIKEVYMFRVFEKGSFYNAKIGTDITEKELMDNECIQAVMQRDGSIMVIEHGMYGVCDFHVIENDENDKYRVERMTGA